MVTFKKQYSEFDQAIGKKKTMDTQPFIWDNGKKNCVKAWTLEYISDKYRDDIEFML